jgi:F0F1-type ATP synthase assembly protein I
MSNDERLKTIRDKIDSIKSKDKAEQDRLNDKEKNSQNMRVGLQAGAELITATIAGAFFGYVLDNWLDTKPLFLIALLILGVITGFVNVWRTTQNIGYKVGYKDQLKNKDKAE